MPLDRRPVFTYGDLYKYACDLVDHLFSLAKSGEDEIAQAALAQLPTLVSELTSQGQPNEAVERISRLVEWALSDNPGISIASVHRITEFARRLYLDRVEKQDVYANRRDELKGVVETLDKIVAKLETGSFDVRLKGWAGGWHSNDLEEVTVDGQRRYRFDYELEKLAGEAISDPAFLTGSLVSWLVSGAAQQSHRLFFHLGRLDIHGTMRATLERIGAQSHGSIAFGSYWGGQATIDRKQAEAHLVTAAASGAIAGESLLAAIAQLGPSAATLRLIRDEVFRRRLSSKAVAGILYGHWIREISSSELRDLLGTLAGDRLESASVAIGVLGRWLREGQPFDPELRDFAWQCLETAPPVSGHEGYECDQVAAQLAQVDADRGFELLETLLKQPEEKRSWCPIDRYGGGNKFWGVLYGADRRRALRTVLPVALIDPSYSFRVTWNLEKLLNQQADADILLEFALESEGRAILVAESITSTKEGFWPIAFGIISAYPTGPKVWDALTQGVEQRGMIWGPYSQHLESCRKAVETRLNDPTTSPSARPWLRDILSRFEEQFATHVIWEYDEDVNDLRRYIECEDKNSPERLWAIGRVLKYAGWKDVMQLLTVEEIEEALPQVDLPEKKRKALEKAVEVWRAGS